MLISSKRKPLLAMLSVVGLLPLTSASQTQLSIGSTGMFISSNSTFSTAGLVLQPSSDLSLANMEITFDATPVDGIGGNSIQRVYIFSQPLEFTGTIGLFYNTSELYGNMESSLAFAYQNATTGSYITESASTLDMANKYVSFTMTGASLLKATSTSSGVVLPVSLSGFNAVADGGRVKLGWRTTFEQNSDRFEIEHSTDGVHFTTLAKVKSANAASGYQYTAYDNAPAPGVNYYRLVQYDKDGSKKSYGTELVSFGNSSQVFVQAYPNPTSKDLNINLENYKGKKIVATVFNFQGLLIHREDILTQEGRKSYPVQLKTTPSKGDYLLKLTGENGFSRVLKISVL